MPALRRLLPALLAATLQAANGCDRTPLPPGTAGAPQRILFVGNSFTYGHGQPVLNYNAGRVTDLNGTGQGGVPGLVKQMADDAGEPVEVAILAVGGRTLQTHLDTSRAVIADPRWHVVVLQEQSTLDPQRPGDAKNFIWAAGALQAAVHAANPRARVYLMETWARADQVYRTPGGRWDGQTLEDMQAELHAAYAKAARRASCIAGVLPVGSAAIRAVQEGVADRNPFDGIDAGKFNLYWPDGFHFGRWGSYLQALVVFGQLTGRDPAGLGTADRVGLDLGLTAEQMAAAQGVASRQLRLPRDGGVSPARPASPPAP